jgi:cysteine desulfurase
MAELRDRLIAGVADAVPEARLSGDAGPGASVRLPGNAHFSFPGCEGDSLLFLLDAAGVAVSTGSACQAGVPEPSHVLMAMGRSEADARGALRITIGHSSTGADVDAFLAALPAAHAQAARAGLAARATSFDR